MTDLNTVRAEVNFANKNLAKATEKIYKLADTMRKSAYETAVIIALVETNQWFLDDGFSDVHAWTEQMFGFKKSASYNLLKIGQKWTKSVLDKNGKVIGYRSALTDESESVDFTTSQVALLLPVGFEKAQTLVEDEDITPEMTCAEIRKRLKEIKDGEEAESDGEEAEETEAKETEAEAEEMKTVEDEDGNTYRIPVSVLEQYRV